MNPFEHAQSNDPIRSFQAEMEDLKDYAERLRPLINSIRDAVARAFEPNKFVNITVTQVSRKHPQIMVMLTADRAEESVPLFRELRKEGITTNKDKPYDDKKMLDVMPMRNYYCNGQDIIISVIFPMLDNGPDQPACRMEQVGIKEVPIYELKCD